MNIYIDSHFVVVSDLGTFETKRILDLRQETRLRMEIG